MKNLDCGKSLSVVEKFEDKSLKEYFRKTIWRYERKKNSKETASFFLKVYLSEAFVSNRDKSIANHIIINLP